MAGAFLQGHILDANNGMPIAGAATVIYRDDNLLRSLTTDEVGFYQTLVPLGSLTVWASAPNYSTESALVLLDTPDATFVQDLALRTAYLQGRVTDANNGSPIAAATVRVSQGGSLLRSLSTGVDGTYQGY